MRGYELSKARQELRRELRRAAQADLPVGLALDKAALLELITGGSESARGNVLTRALILRALRGMGYEPAHLAEVYHLTPAEVERQSTRSLLAEGNRAGAIELEVEEQLVETPEPGRAIAPTGDRAVPGATYPLDPRLAP
jgi:hypothetical protein